MLDAANIVKTETGIEVYENGIYEYLQQYIDERGIENMNAESMNRWNAALIYIHKCLFQNNKDSLLQTGNTDNAYDTDKINKICDTYIEICYEYEKEVSVMGFSNLTGISRDTIYSWSDGRYQSGSSGSYIHKKLTENREECLSNRLYSGRGNPVGILGVLNRHYGWNMGQPRGGNRESKPSIEQIQERYNLPESSENNIQLKIPKADF